MMDSFVKEVNGGFLLRDGPLRLSRKPVPPPSTGNPTDTISSSSPAAAPDKISFGGGLFEWDTKPSPQHAASAPSNKYMEIEQRGSEEHQQHPDKQQPLPKTATTLSQQPKRGVKGHIRLWMAEIIWCALTVGFFGALVGTLWHFDEHELPQWPLGLTVNTLVALVATTCRAMAIVPVEECISQLKWNWFASRPQKLSDIFYFDQASRGPWGALCLVPKTRGRFIPLSTMGALVLSSGVLTAFLTQSTIAYSDKLVLKLNETASVPISRSFPQSLYDAGLEGQDIIEDFTRAAYSATFLTVNQSWAMPEPTCRMSHCEWAPVSSLGVCVSMANVTDHLVVTPLEDEDAPEQIWNVSLPDSLGYMEYVLKHHVMINMSSPALEELEDDELEPPPRKTLGDWDNPDLLALTLSQFFFIYSNANTEVVDRFRAVELLWHFCVNTYEVAADDGSARTDTSSSTVRIGEVINGTDSETGYTSYTLLSDNGMESFNVTNSILNAQLDEDFRTAFTGNWSSASGGYKSYEFAYQFGFNMFGRISENTPDDVLDETVWTNLKDFTGTIADSMTAFMRNTDEDGLIEGHVYNHETYIFIQWHWISFIGSQVLLTVLFLIAVMIHTARMGMAVVKSNNTAELFAIRLSKDQEFADKVDGLEYKGIKTKITKDSMAKLVKDEYGWHLKIM